MVLRVNIPVPSLLCLWRVLVKVFVSRPCSRVELLSHSGDWGESSCWQGTLVEKHALALCEVASFKREEGISFTDME